MWLPQLIAQLNYDEMQAMGLQISAEDIYSVNESSLKDAIVHFNGGCTAELISGQGLLLTNHHCGYSMIQSHSSLEKNYLKDGFWAMSQAEELPNPGVYAGIVKYLKDVTNPLMEGVDPQASPAQKDSIIAANTDRFLREYDNPEGYELEIKPFFYGNQYILIAKELFNDVRLVGAPPSSIGKFGADTDNWVWPRHTGDFSLFRVYADADNQPADYAESNQPYQPKQFLKINIAGFEPGDFTMVYGFPGSTQSYLPAAEVNNIISEYNPARIAIRDEILAILDAKMRVDEATRLKYASKYARISNSWKRWKGEILGVERTGGLEAKRDLERSFSARINRSADLKPYENVVEKMVIAYEDILPLNLQRYYYIEVGYFGIEMMRHLLRYQRLIQFYEANDKAALKQEAERLIKGLEGFYKDYEADLDQEVMQAILPMYLKAVSFGKLPAIIEELKAMDDSEVEKFIAKSFAKNPVLQGESTWTQQLLEKPAKAAKVLEKSTAYQLSLAMYQHYLDQLRPAVMEKQIVIDELQAQYVEGLQKAFPNRSFHPDANSTLRLSYGTVEPYEARDAVDYEAQTFLSGVIEKYVPGDYEFDLPGRLIELYESKDYGPYAQNGKMPVCFVATNHTTGGNSGSPALNARGELIGLNFDRAWEGVMSDMYFDKSRCRNIMVDLRYVLFIVDKFANAGYLIDEMELVTEKVTAVQKEEEREPASLAQ
jgi:hypothetical protein